MSLVVLLDTYERVVTEDGGFSSKLQVKLVGNCSDEIVYRLVDLVGGRIRRRGAREGVKLIELKSRLLSVASPSVELAGAGNGGNVGVGKVVLAWYRVKLPSGVPTPKHKSSFAIAYGATEAHPARYARNKWEKAEARWSTSATNAGTTRIFLAQPL